MLKINIKPDLEKTSPKLSINYISDFFHTWIKRNCNIAPNNIDDSNTVDYITVDYNTADCNIYELYLNDLQYLKILVYEMKKLNEIYHLIDIDSYSKDLDSIYQTQLENCDTFEEQIVIQEKYQRVYKEIDVYLMLFKSDTESFIYSEQKLNKFINYIYKFADKYNTNTLYYEIIY